MYSFSATCKCSCRCCDSYVSCGWSTVVCGFLGKYRCCMRCRSLCSKILSWRTAVGSYKEFAISLKYFSNYSIPCVIYPWFICDPGIFAVFLLYRSSSIDTQCKVICPWYICRPPQSARTNVPFYIVLALIYLPLPKHIKGGDLLTANPKRLTTYSGKNTRRPTRLKWLFDVCESGFAC